MTLNEAVARMNYCPEHGDLLTLWGGRDTRSIRCQEAHTIDEIRALIPEPPTDEIRQAVADAIDDTAAITTRDQFLGGSTIANVAEVADAAIKAMAAGVK